MMTVFYTQSYAQKTLCNGSLYLDGTDDFGRISSSFFDTIPNQSTFTIEFYIKLGNFNLTKCYINTLREETAAPASARL